ncbi:hypothetical protein [Nocardia sp. NPDC020380]|uniref:hypothetical protein n=1 Tax=Nocardia sp. NPDC020380 TaxID=3364309 RepID=UPI003788F558
MRKSTVVILAALVAVLTGAGVVTALEVRGGDRQRERVTAVLRQTLPPGSTIAGVDPHGRPFLLAARQDSVSSAYAEVSAPGGQPVRMFLREITPSTQKIGGAAGFVTLSLPEPVAPVTEPDGSSTDRGRYRDAEVRYTAGLHGDLLQVSASDPAAPVPAAMQVALLPGLQPVGVHVTDRGVMVVLDTDSPPWR